MSRPPASSILGLFLALGLGGNGWAQVPAVDVTGQPVQTATPERTAPSAATTAPTDARSLARRELQAVYFDLDQAMLDAQAKAALRQSAEWLKSNPEASLLVEGYCDKPGTRTYNLVLGERRATAVRDFLVGMGVEGDRIRITSFGNVPGVERKASLKVATNR